MNMDGFDKLFGPGRGPGRVKYEPETHPRFANPQASALANLPARGPSQAVAEYGHTVVVVAPAGVHITRGHPAPHAVRGPASSCPT
jgi:hypothetical protein